MYSGIYAILNIYTDKIYIGSAKNFKYRWKNHLIALQYNKHSNRYLQAAYNDRWRDDPFLFTILEYCSIEKLIEREQYYIDLMQSANREIGYNLAPIAGSCLGVKHSDETKAKLSKIRKGRARTEEEKAAIKAGWKKRRANGPVSEETKRKLSESHKGKKHTEEFKEATRKRMIGNNINSGRKQSPEEIEIRRLANTGKKRNEEQRANISLGITGRILSLETKAKMSVSAKQRHRREEKDLMWTW